VRRRRKKRKWRIWTWGVIFFCVNVSFGF